MKIDILYLLGMFEDERNPLFLDIKSRLQKHEKSCVSIKLFENNGFGSHSFYKEIRRIEDMLEKYLPSLVIAHSLGAYIALCARPTTPLILLDPSLHIAEIIFPNTNKSTYSDGIHLVELSEEFLESIKECPPLNELSQHINNSKNISIYGAGKGGYKIAENYHNNIPNSQYTYLADADHYFSNEKDRKVIWGGIKKWLDTTMSSHEADAHTKFSLSEDS